MILPVRVSSLSSGFGFAALAFLSALAASALTFSTLAFASFAAAGASFFLSAADAKLAKREEEDWDKYFLHEVK